MIIFPNAKINLGLNITNKRADGYHNIETLFYPIPLSDVLEFKEAEITTLQIKGLQIDGDIENNLIIKAFRIMQCLHNLPELDIYLQKNIPFGAGLGGGSSDAAFMLKALNQHFKLLMNDAYLEKIAIQLGADCPFFIKNKPVLAYGLGNEFCAIDFSMKGKWILLVKPAININTAQAYAHVKPAPWKIPIIDILQMDRKHWPEMLKNDFEPTVFKKHPEMERIKNDLYKMGAFYAAMSGSGSTLFGLFDNQPIISDKNLLMHTKLYLHQINI